MRWRSPIAIDEQLTHVRLTSEPSQTGDVLYLSLPGHEHFTGVAQPDRQHEFADRLSGLLLECAREGFLAHCDHVCQLADTEIRGRVGRDPFLQAFDGASGVEAGQASRACSVAHIRVREAGAKATGDFFRDIAPQIFLDQGKCKCQPSGSASRTPDLAALVQVGMRLDDRL